MKGTKSLIFLMLLALSIKTQAQLWQPELKADQAIDWSQSGAGAIPERPTACATLAPPVTLERINAALAACPAGQRVQLAAGTYEIPGTIRIPSNVTLRGAGADQTHLRATGKQRTVIALGEGWVSYKPIPVVGAAPAGATRLTLKNAHEIHAGLFLVVTETNNPRFVSQSGSEGSRNWCDSEWTPTGSLCRGQIVEVTSVLGDTVAFSPGLYGAYTEDPQVVPFAMNVQHAGVEDLEVVANNTGYETNFELSACAYCWIKGVASNYADGDHVRMAWGFRDEIRDSYFSNAFLHRPGRFDSDLQLGLHTSASRIENNILERTHQAVLLQWGPSGNVVAYNYATGAFDSGSPKYVTGAIFFHGAHPQFNLLEGNVVPRIDLDPIWGTSSQTTAFRNWVVGTSRVCTPLEGRGKPRCIDAHDAYQAARAIQVSYLATQNNFVGNVVGSQAMDKLRKASGRLEQVARIEFPAPRSYDDAAYAWSFGYGSENDDGSGTGCNGGTPPCHRAGIAALNFLDGNYTHADRSMAWALGKPHALPPSFYLLQKPEWWGSLPFPATGPEVQGGPGPGGHSYGNPAQACYLRVMGGSEGGAESPRRFNAAACYAGDAHKPVKFYSEESKARP